MSSRINEVKSRFETPAWYLDRRRFNIDIRAETVAELVANRQPGRILDIACGDGSVSIPLVRSNNHLTLLDISSAMLAAAKARIPEGLGNNVRLVNDDFVKADLAPHSFDLIICLGLIAHVDSPEALVARIAELLTPGGMVIMESTDSRHFLNWPVAIHHGLLKALGRMKYNLTLTTPNKVIDMFAAKGLKLSAIYRYSAPDLLPGIDRFVPQKKLYDLVRGTYGSIGHNRKPWLGRECIYLFKPSTE